SGGARSRLRRSAKCRGRPGARGGSRIASQAPVVTALARRSHHGAVAARGLLPTSDMMRITRVPGTDGVARLSVEGRLAGSEVTELATSFEAYLAARQPRLLDLSGVSFIDAQGLGLLHA